MQVEALLARGIEFAALVAVFAAGVRTRFVDAAAAIALQVGAAAFKQQIPHAVVAEGMHAAMRDLPEQVGKIQLAARGGDFLGDVGAAGRALAGRAFVLQGNLHVGGA